MYIPITTGGNAPRRAGGTALLALALVACSTRPSAEGTKSRLESAATIGESGPGPDVRVELDGAEVARVAVASLAERRRLADVIASRAAPHTWKVVEGVRADGHSYSFKKPSERSADQELWLYLDPAGEPSLGTYLRADADAPPAVKARPRLGMPNIVAVRVRTVDKPADRLDELVIRVGNDEATLDRKAFDALPEQPSPRGGRAGRRLRDLVAARVSLDRVARVVLVGAKGDEREIAAGDLTDGGRLLLLKRSRRGSFRFEDWSTAGTESRRIAETRPLVAIEIAMTEHFRSDL